jgi:hypothetical protein
MFGGLQTTQMSDSLSYSQQIAIMLIRACR